jgi:hypothetical protein
MRRTFIADAEVIGLEGEILVTVYPGAVTVAYRETMGRTWGPPMLAKETTTPEVNP